MQCESLTVQCYAVFKLTISSVISKLGNLIESYVSRSIENSLCLIGFISSSSLPVVFHLACSRYIFSSFFSPLLGVW